MMESRATHVYLLAALVAGAVGCSSSNMKTPPDAGIDAPSPVDDSGLPPDPTTVAPALDRSVPTSVYNASSFLYTGDNPIQRGVDPATIDARRVAVLRGRVTAQDTSPVTGAAITILDHPEFGQTQTRADGAYDLVANGGNDLVVVVHKPGFLDAQRTIAVPWQDYVTLPEVVLLQPDEAATTVDLGSAGIKIARGSAVTDASGTRRATLLFAPGTQATVARDSGTELLPTLTVHITEFTVGPNGPQAMPGSLPPTSAYTYAIEVTVDEAGGKTVELSQPAFLYVENFLGFAPGVGMPVGTYDRAQSKWVGHPNGRVLKILTTAGGIAEVDSDGDGVADDAPTLAAIALTDEERRTLAMLYAAGQVLWRSPVPHFSTIDCNEPWNLPADAHFPGLRPPRGPGNDAVDDGCKSHGSIIQCHNQALGEDVAVNGTPYVLHYQSDRQAGRLSDYSADIALSDDKVPASTTAITLDIRVAGRVFHQTFPPSSNQHTVFTWDGKDAYGRTTQGRQSATIGVGYVYQASYADPLTLGNQFAQFPGVGITRKTSPVPLREQVTITQQWKQTLGPLDAQPLGLGGFTLNVQHTFDVTGQVLYLGNGDTRRATTIGQTVLEGRHSIVSQVPSDPSTFGISRLSLRSDGGYYVADSVHRVVYDETGRIVAGVLTLQTSPPPPCAYSGEGGPATQAPMCFVTEVASAPDGALYVLDARHIRRVGADGTIRTIAGTVSTASNPCVPTGADGPALEARLCEPHDLVVAHDGAVYFADNTPQVFKIGVDGYLSIIAGVSTPGFAGDGGPAQQAMLSNRIGLATTPDGSLLVVDKDNLRVRQVSTNGVISTIAGTGDSGDTGDGGPATGATFKSLSDATMAPDGTLYIADPTSRRFRVVTPQGLIAAFAGGGLYSIPVSGCCVPPTDAALVSASYVRVGPDGAVYLNDGVSLAYYRVVSALPSFSVGEQVIPSESGDEAYVFDSAGRHLRTLDASTGAVLLKFAYDPAGRLSGLTDVDGKTTRIERDALGQATAIIGPFGQRTAFSFDPHGYLAKVTDPAGDSHTFSYGNGGLLATYADPLGGLHEFTYDSAGRLIADKDPSHSQQTLTRSSGVADSTVTVTTEMGRATSYRIERLSTGDEIWTNTLADGAQIRVERKPDGSATTSLPDGSVMTLQVGPDPRFGMQSPLPASLTIRTPGGLVHTQTTSRRATLLGSDPLVLGTATETFALNGKTFTRFYDGRAKTVTITSPLGRQTRATLDGNGRIVSVTNPSVTAMQILYDGSGRPTSVAQGPRQLALSYGADGRVASSSDALARTVTYDRDPLGRIKQEHGPDGSILEFGFDAASDLLRIRPPGETDHRVDRDILGLVHSYFAPDVGPNTSETTYQYNADHQVTVITAPDGAALSLSYDTAGRPSRVTLPDGTIDATYDSAGRLSVLAAPGGVGLAFDYDGSLPTGVTWTGPVPGTVHVAFDNDFRIVSESVNGEPAVTEHYDNDGLLTGVGNLTITRDASTGRIKQTGIGSITETYNFNELGELSSSTATCGGTALRSISLTRDVSGVITGKDETVGGNTTSITYDHDTRARLTAAHGLSAVSTYTYDSNGNRLSAARPDITTYSYDAQDRLTQQGSTTYAYTASGQLQTKVAPSGTTSYHYDLLGNLRSAQLPDGRGVGYIVDGMNRRVGKAVDGVLVQGFLYDSATSVVAELNGGGAVVSRFVYGTRSHVPDYIIKGGATYRILSDAVGSPRLVVDVANCQIAQQIDYDEFGRVLADTNPGFQPFGFAGGLRDPDTGLLRFGARDYDPDVGRWTAADPLGFAGGDSNLYAYAASNPTNFVDPSGLSFAQGLTDLSAGFGDMASFGLTRWVRKKLGVNSVVNPCAGLYTVGGVSGLVVMTLATAGLGAEAEAGTGALKFSQTTASRLFSPGGSFAGKSIGQLAADLRAGAVATGQVPVRVVFIDGNGLIVNTRSALALTRAGIPQSEWMIIETTATDAAHIAARLARNGLTSEGTATLRITGAGPLASSLE